MFCVGGIGITSHKEIRNFALWSLVLPLSLFVHNGIDNNFEGNVGGYAPVKMPRMNALKDCDFYHLIKSFGNFRISSQIRCQESAVGKIQSTILLGHMEIWNEQACLSA
jgi:hypothetical protein